MTNSAPDGVPESAGVAIITGGARGIGAATAKRLAGAGWSLVVTDACVGDPYLSYEVATEEELQATVAECGDNAVAFMADVRDQSSINAAVALAAARFGRLDAAIACAGVIWGGEPAWRTSDQGWRVMLDVNLSGVMRLARAAVPALMDAEPPRAGRFVAVTSASASVGMAQLAGYSASKAGVVGFVRSMAIELASEGITANTVSPGSTNTRMLEVSAELYGLRSVDAFADQQPIGRLLEPTEIADTIVWLCGSGASAITGVDLAADGGMVAQ